MNLPGKKVKVSADKIFEPKNKITLFENYNNARSLFESQFKNDGGQGEIDVKLYWMTRVEVRSCQNFGLIEEPYVKKSATLAENTWSRW